MKLVTVLIVAFASRDFKGKDGKPDSTQFTFLGMETDLNGARIPCEIKTFDGAIRDKIALHVKSGEELLIPFNRSDVFAGKPQYNVDSIINHPDYELVR